MGKRSSFERDHGGATVRPKPRPPLAEERQRYRRSKELWHYQMVRLDHEDAETLRVLAKHKRCSMSELIRMFVTWGIIDLNRDDPNVRNRS
jgi:hypothetical protein